MGSERGTRTTHLGSDFSLRVDHSGAKAREHSSVSRRVEEIWEAANRIRSQPFTNGPLLTLDRIDGDIWWAAITDYKHFIAHRRDRSVRQALGLNILGVTGFLCCDGCVYVGRRSRETTQYPGFWELVPSGGITPERADVHGHVSVTDQLCEEMREELGIETSLVSEVTPLAAVEDLTDGVTDIVLRLELTAWRPTKARSDEYDEIRAIPFDEINRFVGTHELVPISIAILEAERLIADGQKAPQRPG